MKPLLMQTLPNSGSTWLAQTIADTLGLRYSMEFFNPARNRKYEDLLARQFGTELISCYRNIAEPGDASIDGDIAATWGREDFDFTKEVFSPFKTAAFARHFRCFVLLRSARETFPPSRPRIWSFYEHGWFALQERGYVLTGRNMRERAIEAHGIMSKQLRMDAARLQLPVIEYDELFQSDEFVRERLHAALGRAPQALIEAVRRTRVLATREEFAA